MSYWRWRGTMKDYTIKQMHKELMDSKGAYWRPYSFYKGMNVFSDKPTGREKSVHIQRSGLVRMQHKTLCGLLIIEEVKDFNYDNPNLCKACQKVDLAVEQTLLNNLRSLSAVPRAKILARNSRGEFAKRKKVG